MSVAILVTAEAVVAVKAAVGVAVAINQISALKLLPFATWVRVIGLSESFFD